MKDKPKFQIGQVARCKANDTYARIVSEPDGSGYVYVEGNKDPWFHEEDLVELTKREIGLVDEG